MRACPLFYMQGYMRKRREEVNLYFEKLKMTEMETFPENLPILEPASFQFEYEFVLITQNKGRLYQIYGDYFFYIWIFERLSGIMFS